MTDSDKKAGTLIEPSGDGVEARLGVEEARLKVLKLQEEVRELQRPMWRRPGFWGALLPSILGIGVLVSAFITGAIDTRFTLMQIQQAEIEKQQAEQEAVRDRIKQDQALLRERQLQYQQDKEDLEERIATLALRNKAAHIEAYLTALRAEGDSLWPLNDIVPELVDALKQREDDAAVELVERELETTTSQVFRAHLLAILYLGAGDQQRMDKLIALASGDPAGHTTEFWRVFGTGKLPWSDDDNRLILKMLGEVILHDDLSVEQRAAILDVAHSRALFVRSWIWTRGDTVESLLNLIQSGRGLGLNAAAGWYHRVQGLRTLEVLEPRAFIVVASELIIRDEADLNILSSINGALYESHGIAADIRFAAGIPRDRDKAEWIAWRDQHRALVDLVMEDDLAGYRANPNRIDELLPVP